MSMIDNEKNDDDEYDNDIGKISGNKDDTSYDDSSNV